MTRKHFYQVTDFTTAIIVEHSATRFETLTVYSDAEETFVTMPRYYDNFQEAEGRVNSIVAKLVK